MVTLLLLSFSISWYCRFHCLCGSKPLIPYKCSETWAGLDDLRSTSICFHLLFHSLWIYTPLDCFESVVFATFRQHGQGVRTQSRDPYFNPLGLPCWDKIRASNMALKQQQKNRWNGNKQHKDCLNTNISMAYSSKCEPPPPHPTPPHPTKQGSLVHITTFLFRKKQGALYTIFLVNWTLALVKCVSVSTLLKLV